MRLGGLLLLSACVACGSQEPPEPSVVTAATGTPHGDHSPHHGGVVMMKGDLHYEVVLDPSGRYRLYFSDASRADLPATTAARASITLMRAAEPPEGISLDVDEAGESWTGQGRPVKNPASTTARIAYTIRGEEPYWIDLPFLPEAANPNAPDPHRKP